MLITYSSPSLLLPSFPPSLFLTPFSVSLSLYLPSCLSPFLCPFVLLTLPSPPPCLHLSSCFLPTSLTLSLLPPPPPASLCLSLSRAEAAGVRAALRLHQQLAELRLSHPPTEKVLATCSCHCFHLKCTQKAFGHIWQ